ncbi:MAG: hypothetical protein ACOYUB_00345 [Patescibacteria group bacterium]
MEKDIRSVVKYFSIFDYPPDFDEIYTFFPKKTPRKAVKTAILKMERHKKIKVIVGGTRYTVGEYGMQGNNFNLSQRNAISKRKLNDWRFRAYKWLISHLPQIKLIGLSGSISMMNAKRNDDIDLFIITARKRLYTGRFLSLMVGQVLGLRRKYGEEEAKSKICLNLFFDEGSLKVPKKKQTLFVGHEVLQMRPVTNKDDAYARFLRANSWVYGIFPNAFRLIPKAQSNSTNTNVIGDWVEAVLKYLQLALINSHKTTETITDGQLWFHPDDFEKKINERL